MFSFNILIKNIKWELDIKFELPYYTKFLLIASYLASYNPPRYDLRFFSKSSENKRRKSKKQEDVSGSKVSYYFIIFYFKK